MSSWPIRTLSSAARASRRPARASRPFLAAGQKLPRNVFRYDPQADTYHCPAGDHLRRIGERRQKGRLQIIYQAQRCGSCALARLCFSNKQGLRRLYRDAQEALAEALARRQHTEAARGRLKRRRESVEPVIGNLKANRGYRRFRLHGLAQVRGEFTLMCIGHNLNKLYRFFEGLAAGLGAGMGPVLGALEALVEGLGAFFQRTKRRDGLRPSRWARYPIASV